MILRRQLGPKWNKLPAGNSSRYGPIFFQSIEMTRSIFRLLHIARQPALAAGPGMHPRLALPPERCVDIATIMGGLHRPVQQGQGFGRGFSSDDVRLPGPDRHGAAEGLHRGGRQRAADARRRDPLRLGALGAGAGRARAHSEQPRKPSSPDAGRWSVICLGMRA